MLLQHDMNGTCTQLVLKNFDAGDRWTGVDITTQQAKITLPSISCDGTENYYGYGKMTYKQFILVLQHLVVDYERERSAIWTTQRQSPLWDTVQRLNYPLKDLGFITATTSDRQKNAEKFLEMFGFQRVGSYPTVKYDGKPKSKSKPYDETNYPKSVPSLWVMSCPDFFFKLFPNDFTGEIVPASEIAEADLDEVKAEKKIQAAVKSNMAARTD